MRVHIKKGQAGLPHDSDVLLDQIRAIDNRRLLKILGKLPDSIFEKVLENVMTVLDLAI